MGGGGQGHTDMVQIKADTFCWMAAVGLSVRALGWQLERQLFQHLHS